MNRDIPLDQKYRVLVEICRSSHFAWREAVRLRCPEVDPTDVVKEMWQITGVQTAEAYLKRLDPGGDLPLQIAESIVWSSICMGEDARLEAGDQPGEYVVRHLACPWQRWHENFELSGEDRAGCDRWFEATLRTINERLGSRVRFETMCALPEGDSSCARRIWEDR